MTSTCRCPRRSRVRLYLPTHVQLKFRMSFRSGTEWVADVKYMPISHKLVVITVRR